MKAKNITSASTATQKPLRGFRSRDAWRYIYKEAVMKYLLLALFFFSSCVCASELEITRSVMHYKESNEVEVYVYAPQKGRVTKTRYTYSAILIVKNISESNVHVATGLLTPEQEKIGEQPVQITIKHDKVLSSDKIIPSISDLKIVSLRPNESARIKFDFKTYKLIDEASVTYSMSENYDNRFGYWTGSVRSGLIQIENPK